MYNKERKTKYSIRKLAVATVSLAIGSVVAVPAIVDSGQVAHAEEQGETVGEKYKILYDFSVGSVEGGARKLPEAIKEFLPVDTRVYSDGEEVTALLPTQTTYEDKENDGVWTFSGYRYIGKDNLFSDSARIVNKGNVRVRGFWNFKPNKIYKASYEFVSGTPGKQLPTELVNTLLPEETKHAKGGEVIPARPRNSIYPVEDGYWVFSDWDNRITGTTDKFYFKNENDIKFIGHWYFYRKDEVKRYERDKDALYFRNYYALNSTPEYELPQTIKDLYPPRVLYRADYNNADEINPYTGQLSYKNLLGTWTLVDQKRHKDPTLYSFWNKPGSPSAEYWNAYIYTFINQIHTWQFTIDNPSYKFVSGTTGKTLPQAITDLTPTDTSTYKKDDVVKAKVPGQITYEDTVNNGTWTFKGYNKNKAIFGVDELKFEGTWEFKPKSPTPTIADNTNPNLPAVTKVDNPAQLTEDEKGKVEKAVKDANPTFPAGTTVTVDDNGDVTITYPDTSTDTIPGIATVEEKEISAKPTVDKVDTDDLKVTGTGVAGATVEVELPGGTKKTTVVKPDGKWEVPLDNPLPKDSVVKVTQTAPGKKVSEEVPAKVVETIAEQTTPNVPAVTEVENKTQLTQEEKGKVEKAVKDANPTFPAGTTVTVDNNGDVTITYPDKSKDTIPGTSTVAEKETSAKPTVDKVDTDDTKITGTGVAGSKIVVTLPNGDTKTTTVKPDGTWEVDLDNPLAKDGEVKVTQEETGKKVSPIAPTTVVPTTAEATTPKLPEVTEVDDPTQLTQNEKDKVVDEVKKANPGLPAGTTVTVDNNGDVTITYPDKSKDTIPGIHTVVKKGHSPAPVVDKVDTDDTKITGEGVVGATVEVELPDGTKKTTVVKPDGKWEVPLDNPLGKDSVVKVTQTVSGKKVSEEVPAKVVETITDKIIPNNPAVTEVENRTQLTQEEKGKVEKAVKDANPTFPAGTKVTVDNNGDVTITYPDNSIDIIPGTKTVTEKGKVPGPAPKPTPTPTPGQKTIAEQITPKTPEVTEVGNKTKLTQGEKGKVEEAVKKANPGLPAGTKITVADNGEVTITYPDGSVDTIPGESTVKEKVKPAGEKAKALPNTGLTANNAVVAGLSILAVAALLAARRKNNK